MLARYMREKAERPVRYALDLRAARNFLGTRLTHAGQGPGVARSLGTLSDPTADALHAAVVEDHEPEALLQLGDYLSERHQTDDPVNLLMRAGGAHYSSLYADLLSQLRAAHGGRPSAVEEYAGPMRRPSVGSRLQGPLGELYAYLHRLRQGSSSAGRRLQFTPLMDPRDRADTPLTQLLRSLGGVIPGTREDADALEAGDMTALGPAYRRLRGYAPGADGKGTLIGTLPGVAGLLRGIIGD